MIEHNDQEYLNGMVVYENRRPLLPDDSPSMVRGYLTAKARAEISLDDKYIIVEKTLLDDQQHLIASQREQMKRDNATLLEIHKILEEKAKAWHYTFRTGIVITRLNEVLGMMQRNVDRNYHNAFSFRDSMLNHLSAIMLMAESCEMASTHREKDARIRGVVDIISSGISTLKRVTELWYKEVYWGDGLLRSDGQIPWLQRENWQLQKRLDEYIGKYGVLKADDAQDEQAEEELPF